MDCKEIDVVSKGAVISPCGLYRYRLDRDVQMAIPFQPKTVLFIGVNPSTANAEDDDATIRKMMGFARRWGYSHITVANLFAYRATDVRQLSKVANPFGPENSSRRNAMICEADLIVPCWGSRGKLPKSLQGVPPYVLTHLLGTGKVVAHLGLTASGDPKHPLMLGYDTPLSRFEGAQL